MPEVVVLVLLPFNPTPLSPLLGQLPTLHLSRNPPSPSWTIMAEQCVQPGTRSSGVEANAGTMITNMSGMHVL